MDFAEGRRIVMRSLAAAAFKAWVASRANRREEWFREPAGRVGVCNVPLPVRATSR